MISSQESQEDTSSKVIDILTELERKRKGRYLSNVKDTFESLGGIHITYPIHLKL